MSEYRPTGPADLWWNISPLGRIGILLLAGILLAVVGAMLFSGGGSEDGDPPVIVRTVTPSPDPTQTPTPIPTAGDRDRDAGPDGHARAGRDAGGGDGDRDRDTGAAPCRRDAHARAGNRTRLDDRRTPPQVR